MAKKYAFLFPGQGAQAQGMMKDVCEAFPAARKVLDDAGAVIGQDLTKLLWETEQETLNRSDNSQLAITAGSLAVVEALKSKGITPSACMGFSLGEFPALYIAGVLTFEDVFKVVQVRGRIMQSVCESIAVRSAGAKPGMSAILGLPPEKVVEIAKQCGEAYAANMNSPKQTVISGTCAGLDKAEEACTAAGARRCVRLAVAGPFHSPLMQEAADKFEKALEGVTFHDPKITLFSNVTGKKVTKGADAKVSAVQHLTHPVLWTDEEKVLGDLMVADTANEWQVLEPGPGKVLSGLWRDSGFGEKYTATPCGTAEVLNTL